MTRADTIALIRGSYDAFNVGNAGGMLDCLAETRSQRNILAAAGFFEVRGDKIARLTTFDTLNDRVAQVSA